MKQRILISIWTAIRRPAVLGPVLGVALTGLFLTVVAPLQSKSDALRAEAIERYGGDQVIALARFVDDAAISLKRRNYAIGMLANLGDARALPVLEKHYTGAECSHAAYLCQYELEKAVKRCRANLGRSIVSRLLDIIFS